MRVSILLVMLFATNLAWADCTKPDWQLEMEATSYLDNEVNMNKSNKKVDAQLSLRCSSQISKDLNVNFDVGYSLKFNTTLIHEAYISKDIDWKQMRLFAGYNDLVSGKMEALSFGDRAHAVDNRRSFLFPNRLGSFMAGFRFSPTDSLIVESAIIEADSLKTQWRKEGEHYSFSSTPIGEHVYNNKKPAIFTQAKYISGDLELGATLWNGPTKYPEYQFVTDTQTLKEISSREKAVSVFGEIVLPDQAIRFDLGYKNIDSNIIKTTAIGYIRYLSGQLTATSNTAIYIEHYREIKDKTVAGSSFDNDLAIGFKSDFNNSALTTTELRILYDIDKKSVSTGFQLGHDLSDNIRLTAFTEFFNIPSDDKKLAAFDNDNHVGLKLNVQF